MTKLTVPDGTAREKKLETVESPTSPASGLALSRFEFESCRANEGTKVLMVEWDPNFWKKVGEKVGEARWQGDLHDINNWEVTWDGKATVFPVHDTDDNKAILRLYFLLPAGASIPALVRISRPSKTVSQRVLAEASDKEETGIGTTGLCTKPLPAIYPVELGGYEAGKRGVLHTIWARLRVAELLAEIANEMKENGESVGLEMALREREWIEDHFGLKPSNGLPTSALRMPPASTSPTSPRSPMGGKLGEKLRGLKLATSPAELVAIQAPRNTRGTAPVSRGGASNGATVSLDAVALGLHPIAPTTSIPCATEGGTEEDLFALPMSPRSPEMQKSPFSILG